jgi:hypothetical protein
VVGVDSPLSAKEVGLGKNQLGSQADTESRTVALREDVFVVQIDFNPLLVQRIKSIQGRRYFGPEQCWFIPPYPESTDALLSLVLDYDFSITDSDASHAWRIARLYNAIYSDPKFAELGRFVYRAPGGDTLFHFRQSQVIADAIEDVVRGVWDKRIGTYRVPATPQTAESILALAEEYTFFVEPDEYQRLLLLSDEKYDETDLELDCFSIIDRTIFQLLVRLPEHRRENIILAARAYRS